MCLGWSAEGTVPFNEANHQENPGRNEKCFHMTGGRAMKLTTITTQGGVQHSLLALEDRAVHVAEWELGLCQAHNY
eukprot:15363678-Ditylum_brightwellii.AAC.1